MNHAIVFIYLFIYLYFLNEGIFLEGLRNTTKTSVRVADFRAKI
jgi:hypothetical protein